MNGFKFLVAVAAAATIVGGVGKAQGEGMLMSLAPPEATADALLKTAADVMARDTGTTRTAASNPTTQRATAESVGRAQAAPVGDVR